jgi:hypothetical protein
VQQKKWRPSAQEATTEISPGINHVAEPVSNPSQKRLTVIDVAPLPSPPEISKEDARAMSSAGTSKYIHDYVVSAPQV